MGRAPLLLLAVPALAGILLEHLWIPAALGGAVVLAAVATWAPPRWSALALAGTVAFAAGMLDAAVHGDPPAIEHALPPAVYGGVITSAVREASFERTFELTLDNGARLEASVARSRAAPRPGDAIAVRGTIEPFDGPRNPGEPSARALAAERGVVGELTRGTVLSARAAAWDDPRAWLPWIRAWADRRFEATLGDPYAAILAGAMWGERGTLPPALREEFQETGTVHILVTAGLHLGVVAGLCALVLSRLRVPRVAGSLASIAAVWLYAVASGAHLPSQRAATMISVALLARACGERIRSWNAYAAAAIIVALVWPGSVQSVSFALSFSCVGAILLFASPIAALLERLHVPAVAREAIALTCATQIGVWPLTAATFLIFAPYAPLANLFVVPVVGIAMTLGFVQLATSPLPLLSATAAHLTAWPLAWIVTVVNTVAHLPGARVPMTPPPLWTIVLYDAAMAAAGILLARRRPYAAAAAIVAACLFVAFVPHAKAQGLVITMLDVGQGDAIVVRTPHGHTLMFDTGGRLEIGATDDGESPAEAVGERVVVPYLLRDGIHRIDLMILTHPHGDHVGGAAPILRTIPVGMIFDSGQSYSGHAFLDAMETARALQVPILRPHKGDVWRIEDGLTLAVLGPQLPPIVDSGDDVNENSIVAMLEYRCPSCTQTFKMLFMGDAGQAEEARLLSAGVGLKADVLKVGHHGSQYASTAQFIDAVRPSLALISVGRHNLFGHPAPQTIRTLRDAGARVYRTDTCAAIRVEVGTKLSAQTLISC